MIKLTDKWLYNRLLMILFLLVLLMSGHSNVKAGESWTFSEAVEFLETSFETSAPDNLFEVVKEDNRIVLQVESQTFELQRWQDYTLISQYQGLGNYAGSPTVIHVVDNEEQQILGERHYYLLSDERLLESFAVEEVANYLIEALYPGDSDVELDDYNIHPDSMSIKLISVNNENQGQETSLEDRFKVYHNGFIEHSNAIDNDISLAEFTSNGKLSSDQLVELDIDISSWSNHMDQVYLRYYPSSNRPLLHAGIPLCDLLSNAMINDEIGNVNFDGSADYDIYAIYSTYNYYEPEEGIITYLFAEYQGEAVTLVTEQTNEPIIFEETINNDLTTIFRNIVINGIE